VGAGCGEALHAGGLRPIATGDDHGGDGEGARGADVRTAEQRARIAAAGSGTGLLL